RGAEAHWRAPAPPGSGFPRRGILRSPSVHLFLRATAAVAARCRRNLDAVRVFLLARSVDQAPARASLGVVFPAFGTLRVAGDMCRLISDHEVGSHVFVFHST